MDEKEKKKAEVPETPVSDELEAELREEAEENNNWEAPESTDKIPVRSAFRDYLQSISRYPLLDASQEQAIGKRMADAKKAGDEKAFEQAKDELVTSNLRLVVSIAKHYNFGTMSMEDLVQLGNMGLITAAEKFDYTKNTRFSTFAFKGIRDSIRRGLQNTGNIIRKPVHMNDKLHHYRQTKSRLYQEKGREPDEREIAEALGEPLENVIRYAQYSQDATSYDARVGSEENSDATMRDFLEDKTVISPEKALENRELHDLIQKSMEFLSERERQVIRKRYGLTEDGKIYTLEEIGREMGITRERVRQLENQAISKLKRNAARAHLYQPD